MVLVHSTTTILRISWRVSERNAKTDRFFLICSMFKQGSDCIDEFVKMQACIEAHPEVYTPEEELESDKKGGA